ncbi:MAG: hypothetical protein NTW20_16030 [Rhodobacterales bacterium]|nr:hypothetical protein [Rhodobacterales bacterium]
MLTIDRMATTYRIAGTPARRVAVSRRLDRLARTTLVEGLEAAAQPYSAEDGPYVVVRRLDLALWFDPSGMADPAIARLWAEALSKALTRAVADAPRDSVARYDNRTAFLADWLADLARDTALGDWRYAEFAVLEGEDPGRAATVVLGREARRIGPVLGLMLGQSRLAGLMNILSGANIASLWRDWVGTAPEPGPGLAPVIERAGGCPPVPALTDPTDPDARARHALLWLVALTGAPVRLPPEVAAPLAMQIVFVAALARVLPDLQRLLAGGGPAAEIAALLQATPATLKPAAVWLAGALPLAPPARLADLAALALRSAAGVPKASPAQSLHRLRSRFAGVGLLLPAISDLHLADRLQATGRMRLLAFAVPQSLRPLAMADPVLRWLAGRDPDSLPAAPINWPRATDLPPPLRPLADDTPTHGNGPEIAALRAVLDRFATGLRGMEGASADYLARQFLLQPGEIEVGPKEILLRLGPVPLRILLVMAGRTGSQGPIPWLGDRRLVVEVANA